MSFYVKNIAFYVIDIFMSIDKIRSTFSFLLCLIETLGLGFSRLSVTKLKKKLTLEIINFEITEASSFHTECLNEGR